LTIEQTILSLGQAVTASLQNSADTYEQDGLLYCAKCNTPLQAWVKGPPDKTGDRKLVLMPVRCDCIKERARLEEAKARQSEFERNMIEFRRTIGMVDCDATFDLDNSERGKISTLCRKYVRKWEYMRNNNLGILFYGSKGTGKTFYAQCIVNALADKGVMTGFAKTSELILKMQETDDKSELLYAVRAFSLLVIDDLGTQRETSFGYETLYNLIDARYEAKKPTIVTTNLDLTDMKNEPDIYRSRIYDRVIQMCPIAIEMSGDSIRLQDAEARKQQARDFMRSED
jgi:DNA replication protein DnaC